MLNIPLIGAGGEIELTVTFGPSSSILLPRAIAYATRHARTSAEVSPGTWRAAFTLRDDPDPYAHALRNWKATEVQIGGSLEPLFPALAMASCAREWLRRVGACRAAFPLGPWPKCELCPLYDAGWAAESYSSPPYLEGGMDSAPDYPPGE